jgi:response regulator RpfG family c-di-GMP phosphodiesterase
MLNNVNIVIVDDEMVNTMLFEELIKQGGYKNYKTFTEPKKALEFVKEHGCDALIVDYNMPEMNGIELLKSVKELYPDVVSIMVTANNDKEMMVEALKSGVTEFLQKPISPLTFKLRLKNILEVCSALKITKDFNKILGMKVDDATAALKKSEYEALEVLSRAAEYKDPETGSHIARVSHYSKLIAEKKGLSKREQEIIYYAAPLHDLGKIGIEDNILLKPAKLTSEEFETMKNHSTIGANILSKRENIFLQAGEVIARGHHEKYNGKGYPAGILKQEIPIYARIVAIADVFDALTSVRPYKKAWSFEDALNLLIEEKGEHFDPELVDLFVDSIDEVKAIYKKFSEN